MSNERNNYPTPPTVTITSVNTNNISHPIPVNGSYDNTTGSADVSRIILSGHLVGTYTYQIYDYHSELNDQGDPFEIFQGEALSHLNPASGEHEVIVNTTVPCNADLDGSMDITIILTSLDPPITQIEDLIDIPNPTILGVSLAVDPQAATELTSLLATAFDTGTSAEALAIRSIGQGGVTGGFVPGTKGLRDRVWSNIREFSQGFRDRTEASYEASEATLNSIENILPLIQDSQTIVTDWLNTGNINDIATAQAAVATAATAATLIVENAAAAAAAAAAAGGDQRWQTRARAAKMVNGANRLLSDINNVVELLGSERIIIEVADAQTPTQQGGSETQYPTEYPTQHDGGFRDERAAGTAPSETYTDKADEVSPEEEEANIRNLRPQMILNRNNLIPTLTIEELEERVTSLAETLTDIFYGRIVDRFGLVSLWAAEDQLAYRAEIDRRQGLSDADAEEEEKERDKEVDETQYPTQQGGGSEVTGVPTISFAGPIEIDGTAQTDNVQINVELNNAHHWHYSIDNGPEVMVKAYDESGQLCSGQEDDSLLSPDFTIFRDEQTTCSADDFELSPAAAAALEGVGMFPEAWAPLPADSYIPPTDLQDPFHDFGLGTDWDGTPHVPWPWRVNDDFTQWEERRSPIPDDWDPNDPTIRWTSQGWTRTHFEPGGGGQVQFEGEPDEWFQDPDGFLPGNRPEGWRYPEMWDPELQADLEGNREIHDPHRFGHPDMPPDGWPAPREPQEEARFAPGTRTRAMIESMLPPWCRNAVPVLPYVDLNDLNITRPSSTNRAPSLQQKRDNLHLQGTVPATQRWWGLRASKDAIERGGTSVCSEPAPCDSPFRSVKLTVAVPGDHTATVIAVDTNHQPLNRATQSFNLPVDEAPETIVQEDDKTELKTGDKGSQKLRDLLETLGEESTKISDSNNSTKIKDFQRAVQKELQNIEKILQDGVKEGLWTFEAQKYIMSQIRYIVAKSAEILTAGSVPSIYKYQQQLQRLLVNLIDNLGTGLKIESTEDGYECLPGQIRNAATGECQCPAGEELIDGSCVPKCPPGQIRNAATGECQDPPIDTTVDTTIDTTVDTTVVDYTPAQAFIPETPGVSYEALDFERYTSIPTVGLSIAKGGKTTYCTTSPTTGRVKKGKVENETYISRGTTDGTCTTTVNGVVEIAKGITCSTGSNVTTCGGSVIIKGGNSTVTTYGGCVVGNRIIGGHTTVVGGTVGTYLGKTKITNGTVKTCVGGAVTGSEYTPESGASSGIIKIPDEDPIEQEVAEESEYIRDDIIRIPDEDPIEQKVAGIPEKKPRLIPFPIFGCTDPKAKNFNPWATIDDGSCEYDSDDFFLETEDFFGFTPIWTITAEYIPGPEDDPICILPPETEDTVNITFLAGDPPTEDIFYPTETPEEEPIYYPTIPVYPLAQKITLPEEIDCDKECDTDKLSY